jgi:hypothetical protein
MTIAAVTTQLVSGDAVPVGTPAQIPMVVAPAPGIANGPGVTPGTVFTFQPGQNVVGTMGPGLGADQVLYLLRRSNGFVSVVIGAATWSSAPSLAHTGTGSALISVSLASGAPGVLDDFNFLFTITKAGAGPTAQVSICYDGSTVAETVPVPAEPPAVLLGSQAITPTVLGLANGLTLIFAAPASKTLTLGSPSLPAAPAGLLAATATSLSPVTVTPSGMIAAGVAALVANPRVPTFTTAGVTPAHVPATATLSGQDYAGNSIGETVVPDTTAGTVAATKAYASFSVTYSDAGGTDATVAIGYQAAYASVAEIVGQANIQAAAAPIAMTASAAQTSAGSYLEWTSTATGAAAAVTMASSPGTGALFGFSANESAAGAAATYPLANTGCVAIFPATNPYILGDTFGSGPVLGPRMSIGAITTAAQAAHDNYVNAPFGFVAVAQPADTASNSKALDVALEGLRQTWISDATAPRDIYFIAGGPWHTASPIVAVNLAAIGTNDAAMLAAFSGEVSLGTVAADDVWLPGSPACRPGYYRRSASIAATVMRASASYLAQDLAEGSVPEIALVGPDGLTQARNENTATSKMGGLSGAGFSVLRTMADGKTAKFVPGATRAGASSRLRNIGDTALANEAARIIQVVTEPWNGQRPPVDATQGSPTQGNITAAEKQTRADAVDAALRPVLIPENGHTNCSAFTITVSDPPSGLFVNTGVTPVTCAITTLGEIEQVQITVALSGTTIVSAAPTGS